MAKPPAQKAPRSTKTVPRKSPAAPPAPTVSVVTVEPVVAGEVMRKKELIDAVVERSGIKKKDAKPVVETMLAVLGDAIEEGRELNLQPFGKLKVNRSKDVPNAKVMICKLRRSSNAAGAQAADTGGSIKHSDDGVADRGKDGGD